MVIIARQVPRGRQAKLEIIEESVREIKPMHLETAEEQTLRVNGYNEGWIGCLCQS